MALSTYRSLSLRCSLHRKMHKLKHWKSLCLSITLCVWSPWKQNIFPRYALQKYMDNVGSLLNSQLFGVVQELWDIIWTPTDESHELCLLPTTFGALRAHGSIRWEQSFTSFKCRSWNYAWTFWELCKKSWGLFHLTHSNPVPTQVLTGTQLWIHWGEVLPLRG